MGENKMEFTVSAGDLRNALANALVFTAKGTTSPNLAESVSLHRTGEGRVLATATDRYMLGQVLVWPDAEGVEGQVVLDIGEVDRWVKMLRMVPNVTEIHVREAGGELEVEFPNGTHRFLLAQDPNYPLQQMQKLLRAIPTVYEDDLTAPAALTVDSTYIYRLGKLRDHRLPAKSARRLIRFAQQKPGGHVGFLYDDWLVGLFMPRRNGPNKFELPEWVLPNPAPAEDEKTVGESDNKIEEGNSGY